MSYNYDNPSIGEVYMMNFAGSGSEQHGWRPGLVFQNNVGNRHSPNIIALPFTTAIKKLGQPTHVLVSAKDSGLSRDSLVLCENPACMSKVKVGRYITTLSDDYMRKIVAGYLLSSAAIAYLDVESLLELWKQSISLNKEHCVARA